MNDFENFAASIGLTFNNLDILQLAFTHRSYVNENKSVSAHNERLEFLGDAVLELVVTDYLYAAYPDKAEGELTSIRAALVNTQSISEAADSLKMNDFLLLSRGEQKDVGRARQYILANTYEAVIGAIYLDQGYEAAKHFITESLFHKTDDIVSKRLWQDAKSRLQEEAQEHISITPHYEKVSESGPDHNKVFTVAVYFDTEEVAQGSGQSKQEAEQAAAQNALENKEW